MLTSGHVVFVMIVLAVIIYILAVILIVAVLLFVPLSPLDLLGVIFVTAIFRASVAGVGAR